MKFNSIQFSISCICVYCRFITSKKKHRSKISRDGHNISSSRPVSSKFTLSCSRNSFVCIFESLFVFYSNTICVFIFTAKLCETGERNKLKQSVFVVVASVIVVKEKGDLNQKKKKKNTASNTSHIEIKVQRNRITATKKEKEIPVTVIRKTKKKNNNNFFPNVTTHSLRAKDKRFSRLYNCYLVLFFTRCFFSLLLVDSAKTIRFKRAKCMLVRCMYT